MDSSIFAWRINKFGLCLEAETLISMGISERSTLAAWGESSGGLLVTASVNMRPDLFKATLLKVGEAEPKSSARFLKCLKIFELIKTTMLAKAILLYVPFVDAVNTMSDPSKLAAIQQHPA